MPMSKSPHVRACWLGRTPYREAWDLQAELVSSLRDSAVTDTLLLLEHPHVFTMGKAAQPDHVLWDEAKRDRRDVDVIWSDRGGEATYHGPGQLVGYPILNLEHFSLTIPQYLQKLEQSLIDYLRELAIESTPGEPGLTGVWSGGEKLAAIGIIVPCGHADKRPTSVEAITEAKVGTKAAALAYAKHFARVFETSLVWDSAVKVMPTPVR